MLSHAKDVMPAFLALSDSLSGSLWLSIALRICLQSSCLAHKALAHGDALVGNDIISPQLISIRDSMLGSVKMFDVDL